MALWLDADGRDKMGTRLASRMPMRGMSGSRPAIVDLEKLGADSRWWTLLMMAVGTVLGGYLGAVIAWAAWTTVGKIARDDQVSLAPRIAAAIVGMAGGALVYNVAFLLFAQSLGG